MIKGTETYNTYHQTLHRMKYFTLMTEEDLSHKFLDHIL